MTGRLTTHVLDTSRGKPAHGMYVTLYMLAASPDGQPHLLKEVRTNADGRIDSPLLENEELKRGIYELVFSVGDYFSRTAQDYSPSEAFLDLVPVRFRVTDASAHIHVPLLVAPGGYSTYRGS
ncbi:hydroxyisourate hydrolase [Paenibacillus sp. sptzw28]|uniref:hydroxyisourate hydrolase n=1 Tax=Paenibacillus sp. sptzw28 TaxID=715179 RepID=UPI001C6DD9A3|nr:hydroxyisourate hydrolase [Paenibacillus sp. sptzw28]QYR19073.1 hydroxyisourate hydrolase [Paenibacillus sp. sptzw28]